MCDYAGVTKPHLTVTYRWNPDSKKGLDIESLGDSLVGMNRAIRDLGRVLRLNGDLSVRVQSAKHGSVIFEFVNQLASNIPFERIQDYYDFMRFVGADVGTHTLEMGVKAHRNVNDFFGKNPVDMTLLAAAIAKLWQIAKREKSTVTAVDENGKQIPKAYAVRLHKLINVKHAFRRALRPFTEDEVSEIKIEAPTKPQFGAVIDLRNFEEYLSEDERILPEYENGKSYDFSGQVVVLEQSMGDHIRLRINGVPKRHALLTAYPAYEKTTVDYVEYYGKKVFFRAEVMRESLYQKPKLRIEKMRLTQAALEL